MGRDQFLKGFMYLLTHVEAVRGCIATNDTEYGEVVSRHELSVTVQNFCVRQGQGAKTGLAGRVRGLSCSCFLN